MGFVVCAHRCRPFVIYIQFAEYETGNIICWHGNWRCIWFLIDLYNFVSTDKALKCISQYISSHPNILSRNLPFDESTLINKLSSQLTCSRTPNSLTLFTNCYDNCQHVWVGALSIARPTALIVQGQRVDVCYAQPNGVATPFSRRLWNIFAFDWSLADRATFPQCRANMFAVHVRCGQQ